MSKASKFVGVIAVSNGLRPKFWIRMQEYALLDLNGNTGRDFKFPPGQKFGSTRAEFGSTRAEFGSTRAEFGSTRAEFGSTRAEFGSTRAEFGSTRAEFGSTRA